MSRTVIGIGLVGGAGAIARFLLDGAVSARLGRDFPFGTLAVNLSGAFVLGVIVGAALSEDAARLLGTGLIGAFTTFSTWALESPGSARTANSRLGTLNFAASLAAGVVLAWLGRELGASL